MGQWNLEREYELLIEEGLANGEITVRKDGPDLRAEPRFRLRGSRVAVRVEPQLKVVDLSAAGIAFLSEQPFNPGDVLHVIIKDTLAIQARVVGCQLVETDPALLELHYRVHCRFNDVSNGKQLLLLMKEIARIGRGVAVN
jgi:PilZ domain